MSEPAIADDLIKEIKVLANEHHATPEIQYFLHTRFTRARARCWIIHQSNFVRNRRDCWALAMGHAPLDVKREIWLHEQDELVADPRAGGTDHYALMTKEARVLGVTRGEIENTALHPFVIAALEAWLHLGEKNWLEAFAAAAIIEVINSDAVVRDGGFSFKVRTKLVAEAGFPQEQLIARNVHVEADQEHATILDRVIGQHVHTEWDRKLVLDSVKKSLDIHRAYRAGVGFAMQQIPLDQ